MNHSEFWIALENFAKSHGMTCSGLARHCGLDATVLNKSKRLSSDGQPRWLSVGTLAKILNGTNSKLSDFVQFMPRRCGALQNEQ